MLGYFSHFSTFIKVSNVYLHYIAPKISKNHVFSKKLNLIFCVCSILKISPVSNLSIPSRFSVHPTTSAVGLSIYWQFLFLFSYYRFHFYLFSQLFFLLQARTNELLFLNIFDTVETKLYPARVFETMKNKLWLFTDFLTVPSSEKILAIS